MKLQVEAAYVLPKFHFTIQPFKSDIDLRSLGSVGVILQSLPPNCIYLLSGSHNFVDSFLKNPKFPSAWTIVHTEIPFREYPGTELHKRVRFCTEKYGGAGLGRCFYSHFQFGGATDAQYAVGVGSCADPSETLRRSPIPGIRRSLGHFWEDALSGCKLTPCDLPPPLADGSSWKPHCLRFNGAARSEGMFPVKDSGTNCVGKSVFFPKQAVQRGITTRELLRLFDIPLIMDPVVEPKRYCLTRGPAPFESALTPNVWAFILRSIWGNTGGGTTEVTITTPDDSDLAPPDNPSIKSPVQDITTPRHLLVPKSLPNDEFDNYSDGDSLMPRKPKSGSDTASLSPDLLSICSGTTCSLTGEEDGSSIGTVEPWEFQFDVEDLAELPLPPAEPPPATDVISSIEPDCLASSRGSSSVDSFTSAASQATYKALSTPTVTTPSQETMNAVREATIGKKAVREDDAGVPVMLWDMRVRGSQPLADRTKAFLGFRRFGWRLVVRNTYLDMICHVKEEFGHDWQRCLCLKGTRHYN